MGLAFLRKYVTTAYTGIVMDSDRCDVYIRVYKGSKQIKAESHTLRMEDGILSRVGTQFLNSLYKQYYFIYAGAMLLSINQGAFSGLGKQGLDKHEIRQVGTKFIEFNKSWTFYAAETDLSQMVKDYSAIGGVDLIFSSYSVINKLKEDGCAVYVLKLHGFASIAVFDGDELLYGNFFIFVSNENSFKDDLLTKNDDADDTDTDQNDNEELDDIFGDDSKIDDSSEVSDSDMARVSFLEKDTKLIEFVRACLQSYYKEPVYDARFIDKVIVLDPYNESEEFKALAEEELLLLVEVRTVNLAQIICDFCENEVKGK